MGVVDGNAEFPVYSLLKLGWRKTRIEDQSRPVMVRIQLVEEGTEDRRFSGSHLSRQDDEPCPAVNAEQKVGKSLFVFFAQEDKAGVGGQVERLFLQGIKVEVHQKIPPVIFSTSNKKGKKLQTAFNGAFGERTLYRM